MTVNKAYKYRIYPTKEQEILFAKHFGSKRFVWNHFLEEHKKTYLENKKNPGYYDDCKSLTSLKKQEEFVWLKEINSQSSQAALRDLEVAYTKFFSKQCQFPRFKSRKDKQSFRIPQFVEYENGQLWIPKCKTPISVVEDRPLTGKILFATISKTQSGKYYVSIACETEHLPYPKSDNQIGVDLGIKDLAITSDGQVFPNIKTTKKYEKALSYEQRRLSRKTKGSKNKDRQRIIVAKVHEKIRNTRTDYIHNVTSKLVRENQTICVEDLSVANMMKNHCLAKSISDASWGEFLRQLEYKCKWNERNLLAIGRFFPSSKTCNHCKFINQDLTLADRTWTCPSCKSSLDRDQNAAQNILEQGLGNFNSGCGTQSEPKQKHVEASSLEESAKHETLGL